ncbi:hypothetical protein M4914_15340 [Streptomyces somaliensis DSM 40738]|uniref:Uncharacterized protein n=1 Tax=Streptomyces somaliensis (strain ATCC 33201 / DSM 40738 / JCM 12659 / KCTC 9044 / NCTC 11332 / NRRL B-12077 / IP 733) TaxID=1134445 RepID=A0AA44DFQ0_STRE0|nr:hypothetical protein [Streptomyces somaliensis]MCQ0024194.1 hypothetical protein [Streptomyces somaliensis DSM 40738]NKY15387.1 hypothetical protein [Streptomyces somaliensis DSM 40738]
MAIVPTDLLDRIRALERQVRELMGSANTTPALNRIDGEVVIGKDGRLRVKVTDDKDLIHMGRVQPDRGPDTPQQGLMVRRDDGPMALTVRTAEPDRLETQQVQIFDWYGNVVVADDAARRGLARPYIPYPLPRPVDAARWESTGNTDWTTLYSGPAISQHPRLYARIAVQGPAGAEVRLLVDGIQVGPVGGPGADLEFWESLAAGFSATVAFEIQAKVAAAGDTVRCRPLALYGVQS